MTDQLWKQFEQRILNAFPSARQTSGSGSVWSDGDGMTEEICFEAKRHQRVSFDAWWKQTRRQAETYHKVPCLVIWRPPVELQFGLANEDEVLAVVPLEYLAELSKAKKKNAELTERIEELCQILDELEEYGT